MIARCEMCGMKFIFFSMMTIPSFCESCLVDKGDSIEKLLDGDYIELFKDAPIPRGTGTIRK